MVCAFLMAMVALSIRRFGRPGAPMRSAIDPSLRTRISWAGTYSQGFQRVLDVLAALGADIVAADPNRGTVSARLPPSPLSPTPLGAAIQVALATQGEATLIDIEVVPGTRALGSRGAAALLCQVVEIWGRFPSPPDPTRH
jgi:hypothetical protein